MSSENQIAIYIFNKLNDELSRIQYYSIDDDDDDDDCLVFKQDDEC